METPPPFNDREAYRSALTRQVTEATQAILALHHPGHDVVEETIQGWIDQQEQLLHNPSVEPEIRERACWSLTVLRRVKGLSDFFEMRKKDAQAKLDALTRKEPGNVMERILTFVR